MSRTRRKASLAWAQNKKSLWIRRKIRQMNIDRRHAPFLFSNSFWDQWINACDWVNFEQLDFRSEPSRNIFGKFFLDGVKGQTNFFRAGKFGRERRLVKMKLSAIIKQFERTSFGD